MSNFSFFLSYYHFALFKIIKKFVSQNYKNVIEIGCAPGNYLVKFRNILELEPFGVEYSKEGYDKTAANLLHYRISKDNVIFCDFFDPDFLSKNRNAYDVVFSTGFIEHFRNPKKVVEKQAQLLKTGGILVCLIPNKRYLNRLLTSKKSLEMHNLNIMEKNRFKENFLFPHIKVEYCDYFGGLFNFGLYQTQNKVIKPFQYFCFALQRIFLDNLLKIFFVIFRRDLVTRFSSPSLICIVRRIK